jgi:hypothetical protein
MLITGCGTSRHAAELGAKIMRDLDCFDTVSVMDSAEVRRTDVPKRSGGLIAVSQSGKSMCYVCISMSAFVCVYLYVYIRVHAIHTFSFTIKVTPLYSPYPYYTYFFTFIFSNMFPTFHFTFSATFCTSFLTLILYLFSLSLGETKDVFRAVHVGQEMALPCLSGNYYFKLIIHRTN